MTNYFSYVAGNLKLNHSPVHVKVDKSAEFILSVILCVGLQYNVNKYKEN